jgi:hypothetical protein
MVLFFAVSIDVNRQFPPLTCEACRRFAAYQFLRFNGTAFTYAAADARSCQIANRLNDSGFRPVLKVQ